MKWHISLEDGNIYDSYCGFKLMKPGASKRTFSKSLDEWERLPTILKCLRCQKKLNASNT